MAVSSTLDFWLTLGEEGKLFEKEIAEYLGVKSTILVNSGSSANLIALNILTSHKIQEDKRVNRGDEIITVAAGFPTTVAPIIQVGAIPVFIDINHITGNIKSSLLKKAYKKGVTKGVVLAHALGNPFDLAEVLEFCKENDLWLIEDNCDSLGSTYSMPKAKAIKLGFQENSPGLYDGEERIIRYTGSWGDISTQSFYPPHHITMGEGGAVSFRSSMNLKRIGESYRDWGRDCWCPSGIDNSCGKRFDWKLGELPEGYDHKYTYSHLGYNLKPLDIQAAIGRVQLRRINFFISERKKNWNRLREKLDCLSDKFEFSLPTHAVGRRIDNSFDWDKSECKTDCSWFGFKIGIKNDSGIDRTHFTKYLDNKKIGHRMFFGGNLLRQPAFVELIKRDPNSIRVVGELIDSDKAMNSDIFLGVYPGLNDRMIDWEVSIIKEYIKETI